MHGPVVNKHERVLQVCAVTRGGAFAEEVVVPEGAVLKLPAGVDLVTAAGDCLPVTTPRTQCSGASMSEVPGWCYGYPKRHVACMRMVMCARCAAQGFQWHLAHRM